MFLADWFVFVAFWTLASIPLGPNAMNCIVITVTDGFRRGLWAVIGVTSAAMCHMSAAALGISTILLTNAVLFQVIKVLGAVYLAWLGVCMILKHTKPIGLGDGRHVSRWAAVRRGYVTSITNPKAILVYFAVFPQFIKSGLPLLPQLAVLVPTALVIAIVVYTGYCAIGVGVSWLLFNPRRNQIFNYSVGVFYIIAAIGLFWLRQGQA